MNALSIIQATVEPGTGAGAALLQMAKECPRPNPSEHVIRGGLVKLDLDHEGYHFDFEWTHEIDKDDAPWKDLPRAEIQVKRVHRGSFRELIATIGLRNETVMLAMNEIQYGRFVDCPALRGMFAAVANARSQVHAGTHVVDLRPVIKAWAARIIAAVSAPVTATVEPSPSTNAERGYKLACALHKHAKSLGYHRVLVYTDNRSQTLTEVPRVDRSQADGSEYVWVPESDLELPYIRLFDSKRMYNTGWLFGLRVLNTSIDSLNLDSGDAREAIHAWNKAAADLKAARSDATNASDYVKRLTDLLGRPLTRGEAASAQRAYGRHTQQ